jgi:glycosyltransferase involved in cell wall biosynthesis
LKVRLDAAIRAPGIAAYADGLAAALAELPDVSVEVVRPTGGVFARAVRRERNRRAAGEEVVVMTNPELPLRRSPVPEVVVVHDLFPLTVPELTPRGQRLRFRFLLPRVCARVTRVVCVTEATRAALVEHVPVDPDKLAVIGQGRSPLPLLPHEPDTDDPYLLFVGEAFPRKNLDTLLAAGGPRLVVAGPREVPGAENVGLASPERLAELYAGATALVLPSVEEGFGRPLLDAFACGVPAIASDIPALREVSGGDAALLVDQPRDPAAWRAAIDSVSTDEDLRRRLVEAGRRRAEAYAWPAIARQWDDMLRSLQASTRRSSGT